MHKPRNERPNNKEIRDIINEVEELDLPDGAHWELIHERLGLDYGEVFDIMAEDPKFFDGDEL